jgi:3-methyladenine DNA glycosylase/8-oxoguanine DNA glycosylase
VSRRVVRERIAVRGPHDLHRTAGFLFRRGPDLRFTDRGLRGVVRAGAGFALIEIEPSPERGAIDVTMSLERGADTALALAAARMIAGLPRDAAQPDPHPGFARAARAHEALAPILKACRGLRLPQRPDPAGCVIGAILAQQVTGAFAAELAGRVRARWGERVSLGGEEWELPPRAEVMAGVQPSELRPLQISQRKAEYIRDLCREIAEGTLDLHALAALPADDAVSALLSRRGIGPTTAAWLLMFGAGHPDAWPPADVGLMRVLERVAGARDGRKVERFARAFAGARSLLAVHLWEADRLGLSRGDSSTEAPRRTPRAAPRPR